jgi:hypothetical protein
VPVFSTSSSGRIAAVLVLHIGDLPALCAAALPLLEKRSHEMRATVTAGRWPSPAARAWLLQA